MTARVCVTHTGLQRQLARHIIFHVSEPGEVAHALRRRGIRAGGRIRIIGWIERVEAEGNADGAEAERILLLLEDLALLVIGTDNPTEFRLPGIGKANLLAKGLDPAVVGIEGVIVKGGSIRLVAGALLLIGIRRDRRELDAIDDFPVGAQCTSIGAIEGVRRGSFSPDRSDPPTSFDELKRRVSDARDALMSLKADEVEAFIGHDMEFAVGEKRIPYTAENFLLSFSQPDFYFHLTIAYAILRNQGVQIGKLDFMGKTCNKLALAA